MTIKNKEDYTSKKTIDEVIMKLGRFEDFYESIILRYEFIVGELDKLKTQGKEKSVRYRELVGNKMMINYILQSLDRYGIKSEDKE